MKTRIAALSLAMLLLLTGCASAAETASDESSPQTSSAPDESAAPLAAESTAPEVSDEDEAFLAYVRDTLLPETQIPNATDEQLIEAGHEACAQLESGVPLESVRVVEGETAHPSTGAFYDTSAIMGGAILNYCPEFA